VTGAPSPRRLAQAAADLLREQWGIFAVLAVWTLAPLVQAIAQVLRHGGVLTGAYGWDAFDQLAYLAWIRDSGSHLLASNLWQIAPTPHDYLNPMFFVSGLLWRLGVSVQVAYLVWVPVGLLILFVGFAAYVRHLLPGSRNARAAALALAFFYLSPVLAIAVWTGHLSGVQRFDLLLTTDDADSALNLWGFGQTAVALGLMPVFLIACERLVSASRDCSTLARGWIVLAAASGALVSWLHPWQGLMMLGIIGALALVAPPRRRYTVLIVPALATVLPLVYGTILSRSDPSWAAFQAKTQSTGTAPWWALVASLGPLGFFALLGLRRPCAERDWMLVLWVLACAAVYFVIPEFPPHALSGVTLPLAVLAVRGWQRVHWPRRVAVPAAIAAIALFTVPAAYYHAQRVRYDFTLPSHADALGLQVLSPDQARALSYLAHAPSGGVLAPVTLSMSVPAMTGHPVYAGHFMWQPVANSVTAGAFFNPTLRDPTGSLRRAILRRSSARYVIADCAASPALRQAIAPVARPVARFGCVTVYDAG
jgi:hypothetical protein